MRNKKIVTIGGGTGSFMLLSGLRNYPAELTAIVSMTDDGGSTGVLRDELGVLPPGDVRQCLVALSDSSRELRELMNYRFVSGGLKGHSFGNLLLSALEKINGSFSLGVAEAAKILNVKGEVIPVTNANTQLCMELKDGSVLKGEQKITLSQSLQQIGIRKNYLAPRAKANPLALKRIREADFIVIGPGNHYSSVVPNLLVTGVAEAIRRSKAKVIYNCNLINKPWHTENYSLDDYAEEIESYLGGRRLDFVTFNSRVPDKKLIKRYAESRELLVKLDPAARKRRSYQVVEADLLSDRRPRYSRADRIAAGRSFIRHDGDKLAKLIMFIAEYGDYKKMIKEII